MFTQSHYETIAKVIAEIAFYNDFDYIHIANGFDEVFRSDNNKYKSDKFYSRIEQILNEKIKDRERRRARSQKEIKRK